MCTFAGQNQFKKSLSFDKSNWNIKQQVHLLTSDDGLFLADKSVAYGCVLTHSANTDHPTYKVMPAIVKTLNVLSKGCGDGEYFGEYSRQKANPTASNGTQCICANGFFFSKIAGCQSCPAEETQCNKIGLSFPLLKENFWRQDMTSDNLTQYPIYPCTPGRCVGSANGTNNISCKYRLCSFALLMFVECLLNVC